MTEKSQTGIKLQNFILNGKRLHSSFDPEKEAARFVASSVGNYGTYLDGYSTGGLPGMLPGSMPGAPSTIVICGEGAGYVTGAVKKAHPSAKIITIFYADAAYALCRENTKAPILDFFWFPGCGKELASFLHETIFELDIEGFKSIEWPASASLFPETAFMVQTVLAQVLKEKRGTLVTTIAMGRRWLQNSFLNFMTINTPSFESLNPHRLPVVIAASGPSLEKSLHILEKRRNRFFLLSLPSSLLCLCSNNITPDAVVMTDPSFYSSYHLRWAGTDSPLLIIMPLSAAAVGNRPEFKIALVTQHQLFEDMLLEKTGIDFPSVLSHGTVAGTALQIALENTDGAVFIAGLDLCFQDIQSHVRPHAFDGLLYADATRVSPYYGRKFSRALFFAPERGQVKGTRTSLALKTYEGWFRSLSDSEKRRIVRIYPAFSEKDILPAVTPYEFDGYLSSVRENACVKHAIPQINYPDAGKRLRIAEEALTRWSELIDDEYRRVKSAGKIDSFINNGQLLQLLYFIDLKTMNHLKREIRLEQSGSHSESILAMLADAESFLKRIHDKILFYKGDT